MLNNVLWYLRRGHIRIMLMFENFGIVIIGRNERK